MEKHIEENLKAYHALDESFLKKNRLKYALFHKGAVQGVYDDFDDTYRLGYKNHPDGDFFIMQIDAPPLCYGTLALEAPF